MSVITYGIGLAKKAKRIIKNASDEKRPLYLSPVRRIERVKTSERVVAMTFDDGPTSLPPYPGEDKRPLTLSLLETLEKHRARGTFDVIGDTSGNYPDTPGKHGSATWGGKKYDHYPDINKDSLAGAVGCPELIKRILDGGHEITNHTYSHVLFGRKNIVYATRQHMGSLDEVYADINRLHKLMEEKHGYQMGFMRPPHYVDNISGGFDSYDACAMMGYQYLAASFDGAGWLPLQSYEQEVKATWQPLLKALEENPDSLCGQIIFQKDGFNMARRTPIADGLPKVLEILDGYGYKVITAGELMKLSPFADIGCGDEIFDDACFLLEQGYSVAFRNNKLLPSTSLTLGAMAMMYFSFEAARRRIGLIRRKESPAGGIKPSHPYSGAVSLALEKGAVKPGNVNPDRAATVEEFRVFCRAVFNAEIPSASPLTHREAIVAFAQLERHRLGNL